MKNGVPGGASGGGGTYETIGSCNDSSISTRKVVKKHTDFSECPNPFCFFSDKIY